MSRDAMKLALEALDCIYSPLHVREINKVGAAMAALREALADQPVQQEPVATVVSESGNPNVSMSWWHEPALPVGAKLYTSPPAQRTWVGLTDEEIAATYLANTDKPLKPDWLYARAIEAKLREKNT